MALVKGGEGISGRLGNRVYRQVGGRTFVSAVPETNDPRTAKQVAARGRLELAMRLWAELPLDALDRWRLYALEPQPCPSPKGGMRSKRGDLVFRGLAAKYLQVHGGWTAPTEPPASPFCGDGIVVSVAPGAIPPEGDAWEDAVVEFSASGHNSPGVVTELLLQRLAARHRKPQRDAYRTQAFVEFAGGPVAVQAAPGAWACAVRFVRADTGQASGVLPIGVVVVG